MESFEQINYNGLLMLHLNKLSSITTSNFIDSVEKNNVQQFVNPKSVGETALEWGTTFLICLVPDDFKDKQFEKDKEEYLKIDHKDVAFRDFSRIKAIVNLLNRKGLLLGNKSVAKADLQEQFFNKVKKNQNE
jgi:hypothetical protein